MNLLGFPVSPVDWWFRAGLEYPLVLGSALFAIFAFGACLGSFLNVCIWRIPRGESVVNAPSHCTACGADIRWFDNLPVVSYLVLRGKCRKCRTPYSPRYLVVELLTGVLFIGVFLNAGLTRLPPGAVGIGWWAVLLAVSSGWIDCRFRIIPDALTIPAMVFALAFHAVFPGTSGNAYWYQGLIYALVSGAVPGIFLSLFAWIGSRFAGRDVLGWGDVKFMIAVGMLFGIPGALYTLLTGSLAGTLGGVFLAYRRGRKLRRYSIAFGPFLAFGALAWIFAGKYLASLKLF